ncbi:LysE family translocator [Simiduia agarivorans]|uniref:Homoserine/threonine efflux protein n=1 Tax=Simiduia agarivorans (strain DSM 21679 / JCM 13881 / BCRC 17597 / SA1) TaxID=1117647 RepID=K4L3V9_SIMAS|nr:LysE family translocator [Simiduia agarivorans]AFV00898.1 homoserine/threonine efflux protein [Simiduia agarivorans SA1 = DSM 21679]
MPPIEVLVSFTFAALLLNLSPGPSNLYVMARSLAQGPEAGFVAAAGLAAGSLVHVLAASVGLAAVFLYAPVLFTAVKLVGAAYLLYLGVQYLRSQPDLSVGQSAKRSNGRIFRESFLVEATNPKTALFFLALLPQFADASYGPLGPQLLVLGLIVTLSAVPCDIIVALGASRVRRWLAAHPRAPLIQERVSGGILVALAMFIVGEEAVAQWQS